MRDPIVGPDRRQLLSLTAGAAVAGWASASRAETKARGDRIKAVVFDAFPIFNPMSVQAVARQLGLPAELQPAWFQKVFADTWLRTSARQYQPFADVLAETLDYVARGQGLTLANSARDQLLGAFSRLDVWPDVPDQLARLSSQGLRLAFLSNMGEAMLRANLRRAGLENRFERVLSTDPVKAFKPAPEAYGLALKTLRLRKSEILFVPFAAWDAAGAGWFGFQTAWVNRAGQPPEPGAPTVRSARDLSIVAEMAA